MFKLIKIIIGIIVFLIVAVIAFAITIIILNRGNKPKKTTTTPSYTLAEGNTLTIYVDVKDSYVDVKKSTSGKTSFTYYASKTRTFEDEMETDESGNVTLTLKGYQTGKWYNRLFLTFKTTKVYGITVEVPDYCNVDIKTNNGNINFDKVDCTSIMADTTNGSITFESAYASLIEANTVNGNIKANSTNASIAYKVRTRKGNITLHHVVSTYLIDVTTDNGKIEVDHSYVDNDILVPAKFILHSAKGNITGTISSKSDDHYKVKAKANNGTSNLNNTDSGISQLIVTTDNGNIDVAIKKDVA